MKQHIYADNAATTKLDNEAFEAMIPWLTEEYGNASQPYAFARKPRKALLEARATIAKCINALPEEIFFTSGGTESDNLALRGCAYANCRAGRHLITTQIEHPAILQTMKQLEEEGFRVTYLPVDEKGCIRPEDLQRAITGETILVSIMHTNNEVGSLQPIEEAGALIKRMNPRILFHVDAVQGYGKFRILPKKMHIDLLSVSGHKIHGPKGIGFLYVDEKVKIKPILFGGGQQNGLRSGTENVPAIAGLAKAIEIVYSKLDREVEELYQIKEAFVEGVKQIPDVFVNGHSGRDGAPHVVSVSFQGVRSEVLLHALEDKGVYVSAGSACSAHKPQPSATLQAMGIDKELLGSTIRFSFSAFTTMDEISYTLQCLYDIIPVLRRFTRK